jgi:hypothetical protein
MNNFFLQIKIIERERVRRMRTPPVSKKDLGAKISRGEEGIIKRGQRKKDRIKETTPSQ